MKGYITIWEINVFADENDEIFSRVFFSIEYDSGQNFSTEVILPSFKSSRYDIYEEIGKHFKGELQFR
jgi:hypothetical protein